MSAVSLRRPGGIGTRRTRLCAVIAAVVLLLTPGSAIARQRTLEIRDMNAQIVVTRAGDVRVTERFTVHFIGSWNGLYRTIPVQYTTPRGMRYTLHVDIESVTDQNGTPLRYDTERVRGSRRIRMWVPDAHDAVRTVVLTYRSNNALRFFEEHDELYWNITGAEWDFPIQRVTAEIMLPEQITGVRVTAFTGAHGSTEAAAVEQHGSIVTLRGTRPLGYGEDLTVAVGWNRGIIERPTRADRAAALLASNSVLLIPLLAFFGMFTMWRRYGRDPQPGSIYVRYEPPEDLSPAEAGTLIDDRADLRDITATLVDLAVRGFVDITERRQDQLFGLLSSRDYELALLHPERWPQLKPHERALLQALSVHADNDRVRLSDLQNQFYKHLPQIRKHLSRTLTEHGFYHQHPHLIRAVWIIGGAVLSVLIIVTGLALQDQLGLAPVAIMVAGGATFIITGVFGWQMPRRTTAGARMHEWLRGFEEFLSRVEKDRLERLNHSPATFERYLPYAMAFGVERNWARAFEGMASEPPTWYHTADGRAFRPNLFVADLARMNSAASTAMTSAPRSSSSGSSGFSGGSSGGGFGGGGGGGF
jgi:uncharacterized membrane protein